VANTVDGVPSANFYEPQGDDVFRSSAATAGPWDPGHQHGGPPGALLTRALERCEPKPDQRLSRVSIDILHPVPVADLRVTARVVRPGRRVTLVEATATDVSTGVDLIVARGWRLERAVPAVPLVANPYEPPRMAGARPATLWPEAHASGYLAAVEWRPARGDVAALGPSEIWTRARLPLVAGETTSGMCATVLVADSASGASSAIPFDEWMFLNVDLTVVTFRDPVGEWILLASRTSIDPGGTGIADTLLADEQGAFGRGVQTLIVSRRRPLDR
jgi:hypothetical protein